MEVSVIVPVYNAECTIERCIDSIIKNKQENIEVILVEDCSSDRSWEICQSLSYKYKNVVCLHNEINKGVSYTRNRGLDRASGKYTMFVDSDDWIDSEYFSHFLNVIQQYQLPLSICGYVNHDEKNNGTTDIFTWTDFKGIKIENIQEIIKQLYDHRLLQQLWNKIFITELIKQKNIRFDESISIGEDCRFVLEYIKKCGVQEVCLINKPLYHYMRDQAESLMYRVGYESIEEPIKNLKLLYEIKGYTLNEIDRVLKLEREKQKELYAYLIFHNAGMSYSEKKKLILALDQTDGRKLLKKNRILFFKEKFSLMLKRIRDYGK
mgnify:CR=1 FL=1